MDYTQYVSFIVVHTLMLPASFLDFFCKTKQQKRNNKKKSVQVIYINEQAINHKIKKTNIK